ncbi:type II toxin-antitoxin system RelE/ParE family toxin [Methylobacter tundripaludum]|uniref:hypothetical protein n=1 Tax=Methylobacter tundripaludum TaxID=173365 RepID=UPI001F3BB938|nr:hypothetical protein [Methylobacter tundripaludum]
MITIRTLPKFDAWLSGLRDGMTKRRLVARLRKAQLGNLGDIKPVGDGSALVGGCIMSREAM